ncbi:MAG: RES family NAD+ phosphorylase [Bryobacterales bacterium]|nr:RES family NAD+ phosphorylase [Bryobacterales bacterium]
MWRRADAAQPWYRCHASSKSPLHFGRRRFHRWDDPDGEYGVLYLAEDPYGAFLESIGRAFLRTRFVPRTVLESTALAEIRFQGGLKLVDLAASAGLTRLGAEGSIAAGTDYQVSQAWSRAIHVHRTGPDGLYYPSRFDPARRSCAVFDRRAADAKVIRRLGSWSRQTQLLGQVLDHYGFGTDM